MMNKKLTTRKLCKLIALMSLFCGPLFSAEKNILFVGNSFTMRHELPTLVSKLLEEGDPANNVKTEIAGYGGRSLYWHWDLLRSYNRLKAQNLTKEQWAAEIAAINEIKSAPELPASFFEYHKALSQDAFYMKCNPKFEAPSSDAKPESFSKFFGIALVLHNKWITQADRKGKLDYVVLQSWLDVTGSSETGYMKYAQLFGALANEIGAKPVLYLTAPNSHNAEPVTSAVNKEELLGTCRFVTEGAKKMNAIVVPVPLALMLAQESTEPIARTLTFRYKKDFHPNNPMAYLTACTFYAALTGKSPEGLKFNTVAEKIKQDIHGAAITEENKAEAMSAMRDPDGGPLQTVFNDESRLFLQRMAWQAVELYRSEKY